MMIGDYEVVGTNHWHLAVDTQEGGVFDLAPPSEEVPNVDPRRFRNTNLEWASPTCGRLPWRVAR